MVQMSLEAICIENDRMFDAYKSCKAFIASDFIAHDRLGRYGQENSSLVAGKLDIISFVSELETLHTIRLLYWTWDFFISFKNRVCLIILLTHKHLLIFI